MEIWMVFAKRVSFAFSIETDKQDNPCDTQTTRAAGMEQSLHVTMATDMMLISSSFISSPAWHLCACVSRKELARVALLHKTLSFSPLYMWEPYQGSSEVMTSIIALTVSSLTCAAQSNWVITRYTNMLIDCVCMPINHLYISIYIQVCLFVLQDHP